MIPSHFAGRLPANSVADGQEIGWVGAGGWKIMLARIPFPNLNNLNVISAQREIVIFLKGYEISHSVVERGTR